MFMRAGEQAKFPYTVEYVPQNLQRRTTIPNPENLAEIRKLCDEAGGIAGVRRFFHSSDLDVRKGYGLTQEAAQRANQRFNGAQTTSFKKLTPQQLAQYQAAAKLLDRYHQDIAALTGPDLNGPAINGKPSYAFAASDLDQLEKVLRNAPPPEPIAPPAIAFAAPPYERRNTVMDDTKTHGSVTRVFAPNSGF
jgi:hypothetical protein